MKTIRIALLIGAVIATTLLVRAEASEEAKKDLAKLQGEWTMVAAAADGQPMPEEMRTAMRRFCTNDEVTVTLNGQIFIKAKITLDPSKTPKTIDYQMTEGLTKGEKQLGIYEFESDTVKFCFSKPGENRPTELKPGFGRTFSTWKKVKETSGSTDKKNSK